MIVSLNYHFKIMAGFVPNGGACLYVWVCYEVIHYYLFMIAGIQNETAKPSH